MYITTDPDEPFQPKSTWFVAFEVREHSTVSCFNLHNLKCQNCRNLWSKKDSYNFVLVYNTEDCCSFIVTGFESCLKGVLHDPQPHATPFSKHIGIIMFVLLEVVHTSCAQNISFRFIWLARL